MFPDNRGEKLHRFLKEIPKSATALKFDASTAWEGLTEVDYREPSGTSTIAGGVSPWHLRIDPQRTLPAEPLPVSDACPIFHCDLFGGYDKCSEIRVAPARIASTSEAAGILEGL